MISAQLHSDSIAVFVVDIRQQLAYVDVDPRQQWHSNPVRAPSALGGGRAAHRQSPSKERTRQCVSFRRPHIPFPTRNRSCTACDFGSGCADRPSSRHGHPYSPMAGFFSRALLSIGPSERTAAMNTALRSNMARAGPNAVSLSSEKSVSAFSAGFIGS